MDVLSDVLRVVRLSGAVFFTAEFTSAWAVQSPPSNSLAAMILPDAECVSLFHVLVEGDCWVECRDHPTMAQLKQILRRRHLTVHLRLSALRPTLQSVDWSVANDFACPQP